MAPTPSGYLHLGNVFSFAVTAALARRCGAEILLRIDDLDRERVQREYVEDIFETFAFLEIPWDRGPRSLGEFERDWSQLHRMPLYREALSRLREAGAVFGCSCSRAEVLRASRDGGYPGTCVARGLGLDAVDVSWRLRTGAGGPVGAVGFGDAAGIGTGAGAGVGSGLGSAGPEVLWVMTYPAGSVETRLPVEMRDFVVRKKDGFPAYQLSSVVDDLHFGVDLIVRGEDLWASTLAQLYLSYPLGAVGFRDVRFYHHPLLTTAGGEKLSKSAGSTSIHYLRRQGLGAAEIYNLIAREVAGGAAGAVGAGEPSWAGGAAEVYDWAGLAALVLDVDREL
ncbi:MAG TPA: glutamate--tRNA ligase family protein [Puia sp.]|nr:glutamate--tRNA ligase family protein [Puia sp.]